MTAETAAPCVQAVQGTQGAMASQSMLQQVQDGSGGSGGGGGVSAYYSSTSTSTVYDPEYARMESWLDEHPDFVNDYFLRYFASPLKLPIVSTTRTELLKPRYIKLP